MIQRVYVDSEKLSRILYTASLFCKVPIRFFNDAANCYISTKREDLPFCAVLARVPKAHSICSHCNEVANQHCREKKTVHSYHCHANLIEIVYPVFYDNVYVGHLTAGQLRSPTKTISEKYLLQLAELVEKDPVYLKKKYYLNSKIEEGEIEGAKIILELLANKLISEGIFSLSSNDVVAQVEQYIIDHISDNLTLDQIAANSYLNPSYLSSFYHKHTGHTLSNFIQHTRNMKAHYLFSNTDLSISEVAHSIGYDDANYFTKVFKKEFGYPPRECKRRMAEGIIVDMIPLK